MKLVVKRIQKDNNLADFNKYFPILIKLEGGWSEDPDDHGGATNIGVTLQQWIDKGYDKDGDGDIDKNDLKLISKEDAANIAKPLYWDKMKGDFINSQSVAEFITDWAYNSGVFTASKKLQRVLGVEVDGKVGKQTLAVVNGTDARQLFEKLKVTRENFYLRIVANDTTQGKFLTGWLNRNNSFKFND